MTKVKAKENIKAVRGKKIHKRTPIRASADFLLCRPKRNGTIYLK